MKRTNQARVKRRTSLEPNRMLMRENKEFFLICIPFGSCEVQRLTPASFTSHDFVSAIAFQSIWESSVLRQSAENCEKFRNLNLLTFALSFTYFEIQN